MDFYELPGQVTVWLDAASNTFQRVPGSAVLIRYVRSSYQNDPVRSAIELILVIFFIRYLLSPSYSTSKQNFIKLSEDVSKTPNRRPLCVYFLPCNPVLCCITFSGPFSTIIHRLTTVFFIPSLGN